MESSNLHLTSHLFPKASAKSFVSNQRLPFRRLFSRLIQEISWIGTEQLLLSGPGCFLAGSETRVPSCGTPFSVTRKSVIKANASSPPRNNMKRIRQITKGWERQTTWDNWGPVTTILAALFDRGFFLITISTSRSSALRKCISRSTENPSNR